MKNCAKEVAQYLLADCGLSVVLQRMEEYKVHGTSGRQMAEDPALSLTAISQAMKAYFGLISTPDALPEFTEIVDADIKHALFMKMCRTLTEAYEQVYNAVMDPENSYGPPSSIHLYIEHSPEHIRTILSVE